MNDSEIIEGLKALRTIHNGNYAPYVDEAIKRLSVEPHEDYISRQEAINKMQELEDEDIKAYGCEIPEGFDGKRAIEALKLCNLFTPKSNIDKLVQMRDATPEERESIGKYINSMSKLTGVNFEDLQKEPREDKEMTDKLSVLFDNDSDGEARICISRLVNGKTHILKMELGEQADILYHLLTEQMTKAKSEG